VATCISNKNNQGNNLINSNTATNSINRVIRPRLISNVSGGSLEPTGASGSDSHLRTTSPDILQGLPNISAIIDDKPPAYVDCAEPPAYTSLTIIENKSGFNDYNNKY